MMNLMLDFETLDTKPSTVVLSLGAVLFDDNQIVATKYLKFKVDEQIASGRTVSMDTIRWWMRQSPTAGGVLDPSDLDVDASLLYFFLFSFLDAGDVDLKTLKVWGNGSDFDLPIANSLLASNGKLWEHWNSRCFRTFKAGRKFNVTRSGTHHNALDDAIYQAECVLSVTSKK